MDKRLMEERIRQLMALDRNAVDIYTDLAKNAPNSRIRETLLALAIDESRHVKAEHEVLSLILK